MARRKCYGYEVGPNGELTVNLKEAKVVRWIFEQYIAGLLYRHKHLIRNNGLMSIGIEIPSHETIVFNLNCVPVSLTEAIKNLAGMETFTSTKVEITGRALSSRNYY